MDEQSKAWFKELKDSGYKDPDVEKGECCKTILFGDLASLNADVHNSFWDGSYLIRVNFCPHCGKSMKDIRDKAIEDLKTEFGTPENFIKDKGFDKIFLDGGKLDA